MILSEHFTLDELLASPTATARGFSEQFIPSEVIVGNLQALDTEVLEPIRVLVDFPINVSSGYRCLRLNQAVGGEPTSQHLFGQAADITSPNLTVDELYQKIKAGAKFDELIIEHDHSGHYWVHVSWNPTKPPRGICYKGVLQPTGGTICSPDGYGAFKALA